MNRKRVWLPAPTDGSQHPTFYYVDVEDMHTRLLEIINTEVRLSDYQRRAVLEAMERNKRDNWDFLGEITFKFERGSDEASVRFRVRKTDELVTQEPENATLVTYNADITCSWCASEFDLGRAMVQAALHQECVALMGQLDCEFGAVIGRLVRDGSPIPNEE